MFLRLMARLDRSRLLLVLCWVVWSTVPGVHGLYCAWSTTLYVHMFIYAGRWRGGGWAISAGCAGG